MINLNLENEQGDFLSIDDLNIVKCVEKNKVISRIYERVTECDKLGTLDIKIFDSKGKKIGFCDGYDILLIEQAENGRVCLVLRI